jgi:hypothetical protein
VSLTPLRGTFLAADTSDQANGAAEAEIDDPRVRSGCRRPRRALRERRLGAALPLAALLRRNAKHRAVARALRRNAPGRLERLLNFRRSVEVQSLITRRAVNFNENWFPRRGRYVMVCFFEGHNAQGMLRFVRVR